MSANCLFLPVTYILLVLDYNLPLYHWEVLKIYIKRWFTDISNNFRISGPLLSLQLKLVYFVWIHLSFTVQVSRAACFYAMYIIRSQENIATDSINNEVNACWLHGRSCSNWQFVTDVYVMALNHCTDSLYSIFYSTFNNSYTNKLKCSCQNQLQSWRHTYNVLKSWCLLLENFGNIFC